MITLGVILLIVGFIIKFPVLWSIGIIVLVIGLVLVALGAMGRAATRSGWRYPRRPAPAAPPAR
jgi:multisubunit Na+/H+ antiporter MnhG subunit